MSVREWLFAALTFVAGVLVVVGVFRVFDAAGFMVAGVLLAVWSWLVLSETE